MSNPTANLNISFYSCWLPEVALPTYPGGITLPPPIAPLPNPALPFPDTSGLPDPEVIPADYCSKLIYAWLITASFWTPTAQALMLDILPTAFDTLDTSNYDAALIALIDQYNADVALLVHNYMDDVLARQIEISQLEGQLRFDIAQIDANYQATVAQRTADIAECEAARYPDPPEPGLRLRVATHGPSSTASSTSSTSTTSHLRTVFKLRCAA